MAEARVANPLVAQFRKGRVPLELRQIGAQGALPLKPADLVELLVFLLADTDEGVCKAAATSLGNIAVEELQPIFKDRTTPPGILAWALSGRQEKELREIVLQNPTLSDEALEPEVAALPEELAELVVINQVRLLRRTSLLEALEGNPHLSNDQRRRLRELRETFGIGGEQAASPEPAAPEEAEPPEEEEPEAAAEEGFASEAEAVVRILTAEEQQEAEKVSTVQRLSRMTVAERVVTALKGSREERAVLVRDPSRIVSAAVLGSPRLTDPEIEAFAGMRNISEAILRQIGNNREWMRNYHVMANLVKNPRTPVPISMNMIPRLNPRDLKNLSTDRNVSEVIRRHAQKFVRSGMDGKR
jgi:hypothetical protein